MKCEKCGVDITDKSKRHPLVLGGVEVVVPYCKPCVAVMHKEMDEYPKIYDVKKKRTHSREDRDIPTKYNAAPAF